MSGTPGVARGLRTCAQIRISMIQEPMNEEDTVKTEDATGQDAAHSAGDATEEAATGADEATETAPKRGRKRRVRHP